VCSAQNAQHARIAVEDTGIGIDREMLEQLFTMFQQGEVAGKQKPGLGIGLALVKGIVERHGGSVWAESGGPGKGSRFVVELPLSAPPRVRTGETQAEEPNPHPIGILVVEDNPDTRTLVADTLTLAGYEVQTAGSGEDALALLRDGCACPEPRGVPCPQCASSAPHRPDMILCDIGLPGIDGFEFLRRARELPGMAEVPAFAVTGFGSEEDVRYGRETGFVGHFVKPVDINALDARIREWVAPRDQRP
jgi:CheY-like chemotaxis protein